MFIDELSSERLDMNAKGLCLTVCGLFESKLVIISADCVIVLMQGSLSDLVFARVEKPL